MKDITSLFDEAVRRNRERGHDKLYVAVDVHGTIFRPTRITEVVTNDSGKGFHEEARGTHYEEYTFYPFAEKVLLRMSDSPDVKLILWTSTQNAYRLTNFLKVRGIRFDHLNQNPDFQFNSYADFSKKFYFDVLLDDKAGFDANEDWERLLDYDFNWR